MIFDRGMLVLLSRMASSDRAKLNSKLEIIWKDELMASNKL